MSYAQLDWIADKVNIALALVLIAGTLVQRGHVAWLFLLQSVAATVLVQQSAKLFQKIGWLGPHFPSTHFAVALCLATLISLLGRKWTISAVVTVAFYGALMLYQNYHTPLEMVGAFYAIPIAWWAGHWKRKSSGAENDKIIVNENEK